MVQAEQPQASADLIMSRAELVYVLNALQTNRIVGIDLKEFGLTKQQFQDLLREGEQSLLDRSLLEVDDATQNRLLAPALVGMVGALAFRSIAVVLVRGSRGEGQQMFVFNLYQDTMIEHTQPQEGVHRLALIPTLADMYLRMEDLVPLHPVTMEDRPKFIIPQAEFEDIQRKVQEDEDVEAAGALATAGLDEELTPVLVQVLQNPMVALSLAFLKCEEDRVVDARSLAVFANEQSSWGIWSRQEETDTPQFIIFPTGINDVWLAFVDWIELQEKQTLAL